MTQSTERESAYAEIRRLAEAANNGDAWFLYSEPEVGISTVFTGRLAEGSMRPVWDSSVDQAYIVAAQPSAVLGLLDRIAELEKGLEPFAAVAEDYSGVEAFDADDLFGPFRTAHTLLKGDNDVQ